MDWAESPQPKELRRRPFNSNVRNPSPVNYIQQSCALRRLSESVHKPENKYVSGLPKRQTMHGLPCPTIGSSNMAKSQPLKLLARSLTGPSTPEKGANSKIGNGSGGTPVNQGIRNYSPELIQLREAGKKKKSFLSSLFHLVYGFIYRVLRIVFYVVMSMMAVLAVGTLVHQYRHIKTGVCMYYNSFVNVSMIQHHFMQELYGQHIASELLVRRLREHCNALETSSRPLVLSLHGWTGGGKSLTSALIAREFPVENIHEIIVPLHFPHADEAELYKARLNASIMSHVLSCDKHLFIIDDIDKAAWDFPSALQSVLAQLKVAKLQHASLVVLLLSNTGALDINKFTLNWLLSGNSRDSLKHKDLHDILLRHTGWHSQLYRKGLITALVPLLPLEQSHVEQCVRRDLQVKGHEVSRDIIENVVHDVFFFPTASPIFATSGCRKISTLVDLKVT